MRQRKGRIRWLAALSGKNKSLQNGCQPLGIVRDGGANGVTAQFMPASFPSYTVCMPLFQFTGKFAQANLKLSAEPRLSQLQGLKQQAGR